MKISISQKKAKGCELLEKVFNHLDITSERDYFGLKICQSSECEVSQKNLFSHSQE